MNKSLKKVPNNGVTEKNAFKKSRTRTNASTKMEHQKRQQKTDRKAKIGAKKTRPMIRVLYCAVLDRSVPHCTVLYCTSLYCTVLNIPVHSCIVLLGSVWHCTVLQVIMRL